MREKEQPSDNADAMLVNQCALRNAIETVANEASSDSLVFVESEPFLSAFCRVELLQTLGKLAVSGASPEAVRGVGADVHRLITITAIAMKSGYGNLLEDFLPAFAPTAEDSQEESAEGNEADQ